MCDGNRFSQAAFDALRTRVVVWAPPEPLHNKCCCSQFVVCVGQLIGYAAAEFVAAYGTTRFKRS